MEGDNNTGFHKYGLTFKKLSSTEDYPIWRQHMEYALSSHGLWEYVNGQEPQPSEPQYGYKYTAPTVAALQLRKQQVDHQDAISAAQDAGTEPPAQAPHLISKANAKDLLEEIEVQIKEMKRWKESDHNAQSMISYMVTPSALQPVMNSTTSKKLWDNLEIEYQVRGPRILLADFNILVESKISDFKTPVEYIKAVTEAASRLNQMGCIIQDHITVLHLQRGLTSEWNSVKARYLDRKERTISLQNMKNLILQGIPDPAQSIKPSASAQYSSAHQTQIPFKGNCNRCGARGHKAGQCHTRNPEEAKKRSEERRKRRHEGHHPEPSKKQRTEENKTPKDK